MHLPSRWLHAGTTIRTQDMRGWLVVSRWCCVRTIAPTVKRETEPVNGTSTVESLQSMCRVRRCSPRRMALLLRTTAQNTNFGTPAALLCHVLIVLFPGRLPVFSPLWLTFDTDPYPTPATGPVRAARHGTRGRRPCPPQRQAPAHRHVGNAGRGPAVHRCSGFCGPGDVASSRLAPPWCNSCLAYLADTSLKALALAQLGSIKLCTAIFPVTCKTNTPLPCGACPTYLQASR